MERSIAAQYGIDDPAVRPPADAGEGRIRRSWRLTKTAWNLVRQDSAMLALALLGLSSGLIFVAVFTLIGGYSGDAGQGEVLIAILIALYPSTFLGVFFNVALASAANAVLEGRRLSFGEAIGESRKRLGKIALWSLLAAGVGAALAELSSRIPGGGRIASALVGAAWGVATLFVVPILATTRPTPGPFAALKDSVAVVRQRWGEGISGTVTITVWLFFVTVPAGFVLGAGFVALGTGSEVLGAVLVATGGLLVFAAAALASAVQQVFLLCLYRYATDGSVRGFSEQDLANPPFRQRRGFFR